MAVEEAVDGLPDPPYPSGISKPFDVVVKDGPCEIHESRARVTTTDQADVDAFEAASLALAGEYDDVRCTIVSFDRRSSIEAQLRLLRCVQPIYGVGLEDLPALAIGPPTEIVGGRVLDLSDDAGGQETS